MGDISRLSGLPLFAIIQSLRKKHHEFDMVKSFKHFKIIFPRLPRLSENARHKFSMQFLFAQKIQD